jgi:acetyl-CoA carboxylase biotin carboxylase subunit
LRKILIANRGEIAVRIVRACRDLGLASVAVYSDADRFARHVRMADEACPIGPAPAAESYLRVDRILAAARAARADAIHPGYGFLSENAALAGACRDAGITFIGPSPEAIALMGSKTAARSAAIAAGVPVVPGADDPIDAGVPDDAIAGLAERLGYPVMVKAVAGGGGKGMRVVRSRQELPSAIRAARSEAAAAFGDSAIYLERRLERPRHVEVQLLADARGVVLPFVERECSIQRRHQKLVEESPSPAVSAERRGRLAAAAAAVARSAGYTNAGTIEFLLDETGRFYFLEMNTRLQVEHAVTETITGVDLVEWQIRIARGEPLTIDPDRLLTPRGHAIECRIYAEDADAGFLPSPGQVRSLRAPAGPWVRDDGAVDTGGEVPIFYDPLISKLIAWGEDRDQAIRRMRRALPEYEAIGVRTTVPFFTWLFGTPRFLEGRFHTGFLDELLQERQGLPFSEPGLSYEEVGALAAALAVGAGAPAAATLSSSGGLTVAGSGATAAAAPKKLERAGARSWRRAARLEALRD